MPSSTLKNFGDRFNFVITNAYGHPGAAFGGIQIAGEDLRMPAYRAVISKGDSVNPATVEGTTGDWMIEGLPLAPRSSKSLSTQVCFRASKISEVEIHQRAGSELLAGELVNPLPSICSMACWSIGIGLTYCRHDFPAVPRSLRSTVFVRRIFAGSCREKRRWKVPVKAKYGTGRTLVRFHVVAEMLMFHDAVGGTRYTGLKHDPLASLDLSHVLTDDRCVLVGRTGYVGHVASTIKRYE